MSQRDYLDGHSRKGPWRGLRQRSPLEQWGLNASSETE